MSQIDHIRNHRHELIIRSETIRLVREFFYQKNFLEVETPQIVALPGQEPYLSPIEIFLENEAGTTKKGYLHTSPEYALKKMLSAGFENIFSLGKVFRNQESFGGTHNPEFTMLEWYRTGTDFYSLMDDCEDLFSFVADGLTKKFPTDQKIKSFKNKILPIKRLHMNEVWGLFADVNLENYLERDRMFELCAKKGYAPQKNEVFADLFFRIFLNEIEPRLSELGPIILHHYPAELAALSRLSQTDRRYAERFELYVGGLELANAFSELIDPEEQRARLQKEQNERQMAGKPVFAIDEEFILALKNLPDCAGIALGIDRLIMLAADCQEINSVLALPADTLFNS